MEYTVGGVLVLLLLISPKGLPAFEVMISSNPVAVGENVNLELIPQTDVKTGIWLHENDLILLGTLGGAQVADPYRDRITFDAKTFALSLKNVTLEDSGSYSAQGLSPSFFAEATLFVLEPVSDVIVTANATDLVELNDTVRLTCSASGSSPSWRWVDNSSDIRASERFQLSDDNMTLTISGVLRSDSGSLYCIASNSISNATSQPVFLNISYGPDNVEISGNPPNTVHRAGSDIVLSCRAQSKPPANYLWTCEGILLQQSGPELILNNVRENQSGNYSCWAHNSVTLRYSSMTSGITIIAPITNILVNYSGGLPIEDKPFTLVCKFDGKAMFIQWLRDGLPLVADNRTAFSADNSSVTLTSVQRSDDGSYQCEAYNEVSNATSPEYHLLVNYGPEQPVITGPDVTKTGSNVTFNCSALSQPPSHYSWYFNGTRVAHGAVYVTLAKQGTYTCVASNSITGRNSSEVKDLTVIEPVSDVIVTANATDLVELNDTVRLTCSASGSSPSLRWVDGSSDITASERFQLSDDNMTLTISGVLRSDNGSLYCIASNSISNATSQPVFLNISYGPDNVEISGNPPNTVHRAGSDIVLSCRAQSKPPANYLWTRKGILLQQSGPELILNNVRENQSGNYSCWAHNSVTLRYSSMTSGITIIDPVSALVNSSGGFPIEDKPFTLVCQVNGKATFIQWLRDGLPLVADNRTTFSADNSSVTFTPVQRSDDGSYQCEAYNEVSNATSHEYHLLVNYGPEQPVITGPGFAKTGSNVTFTCNASSQPRSQYSWYFSGRWVADGAEYVTLAKQGTYTCVASNSITGRNSSEVKELTVIGPVISALVNSSGGFPIEDKQFTLVCQVNGKATFIQWLRDGLPLVTDNRTAFSADNSSVNFTSVQRSDDGSYQCEAYNEVSNATSPEYHLLVNYGPEKPVITGQESAKTGSVVTFTCTALSQPPSQYSWHFNGSTVGNSPTYMTAPLTLADEGAYTCEAFNAITGRNSTAVTQLKVTDYAVISKGSLFLTALGVSFLQLTNWLSC